MNLYEQRKRESIRWSNKASDLRGGAAVLWASMNSESREIAIELGLGEGFRMSVALPSVYRMVCGMSMELLLKTIIVARGKEPESTHFLDKLAADAGVVYTRQQLDLLRILSEAIIWDGKYPVPEKEEHWEQLARLEEERLFDKVPLGDSGLEALRGNGTLDWDSYSELWGIAFSVMCEVVDWLDN